MNRNECKIGQQVAWKFLDGSQAAGTITDVGYSKAYLTQVDGGACTIDFDRIHLATPEEVLEACAVKSRIGK